MRSNRFIKRLDLYIIKKFLGTYVFAIALIISIAVVFDFNEKMDKFMERSAPWSAIIFDYYMNFIPYFARIYFIFFYLFKVLCYESLLPLGITYDPNIKVEIAMIPADIM